MLSISFYSTPSDAILLQLITVHVNSQYHDCVGVDVFIRVDAIFLIFVAALSSSLIFVSKCLTPGTLALCLLSLSVFRVAVEVVILVDVVCVVVFVDVVCL